MQDPEQPEETPALDEVADADEFVGDEVEPEHDLDLDSFEEEDDEEGGDV